MLQIAADVPYAAVRERSILYAAVCVLYSYCVCGFLPLSAVAQFWNWFHLFPMLWIKSVFTGFVLKQCIHTVSALSVLPTYSFHNLRSLYAISMLPLWMDVCTFTILHPSLLSVGNLRQFVHLLLHLAQYQSNRSVRAFFVLKALAYSILELNTSWTYKFGYCFNF